MARVLKLEVQLDGAERAEQGLARLEGAVRRNEAASKGGAASVLLYTRSYDALADSFARRRVDQHLGLVDANFKSAKDSAEAFAKHGLGPLAPAAEKAALSNAKLITATAGLSNAMVALSSGSAPGPMTVAMLGRLAATGGPAIATMIGLGAAVAGSAGFLIDATRTFLEANGTFELHKESVDNLTEAWHKFKLKIGEVVVGPSPDLRREINLTATAVDILGSLLAYALDQMAGFSRARQILGQGGDILGGLGVPGFGLPPDPSQSLAGRRLAFARQRLSDQTEILIPTLDMVNQIVRETESARREMEALDRQAMQAMQREAEALRQVQDRLFGRDLISRASQYLDALGGLNNIQRMTLEGTRNFERVLLDAAAALRLAGDEGSVTAQKIAQALQVLQALRSVGAEPSAMMGFGGMGVPGAPLPPEVLPITPGMFQHSWDEQTRAMHEAMAENQRAIDEATAQWAAAHGQATTGMADQWSTYASRASDAISFVGGMARDQIRAFYESAQAAGVFINMAGWGLGGQGQNPFTSSTPIGAPIPHLADGGIVQRPTFAMIGERGPEAVVPLGRSGGMGLTMAKGAITIVTQPGQNADAIAEAVMDRIVQRFERHLPGRV